MKTASRNKQPVEAQTNGARANTPLAKKGHRVDRRVPVSEPTTPIAAADGERPNSWTSARLQMLISKFDQISEGSNQHH